LEEEENDVDNLEQKLEKVIKMCSAAVESGKEYVKNQRYNLLSLFFFTNSITLCFQFVRHRTMGHPKALSNQQIITQRSDQNCSLSTRNE
jgi:hypothetical protein